MSNTEGPEELLLQRHQVKHLLQGHPYWTRAVPCPSAPVLACCLHVMVQHDPAGRECWDLWCGDGRITCGTHIQHKQLGYMGFESGAVIPIADPLAFGRHPVLRLVRDISFGTVIEFSTDGDDDDPEFDQATQYLPDKAPMIRELPCPRYQVEAVLGGGKGSRVPPFAFSTEGKSLFARDEGEGPRFRYERLAWRDRLVNIPRSYLHAVAKSLMFYDNKVGARLELRPGAEPDTADMFLVTQERDYDEEHTELAYVVVRGLETQALTDRRVPR